MAAKYELKKSGTQFMWNLIAPNGEKILTSERYTTKSEANDGIASCKRNSPFDARYERKDAVSSPQQYYFVLKAENGRIIGTSETYTSTGARDNGINSCKQNGPTATTDDKT